ncbi:YkoP family protein [Tumebacillus flagellatus]|uniref:YkoP-like domain-containing protein n=1 Tax=Tumebacillus flagellatus TaxID=1157490 RepID=A0A074LUY9_9BACL|nr:hypothetical protein [Tumebacillus flagellatus]KEO84445.1 hypothetical protein EL26_04920 [Tumebacillus flagellatus]
MNRAMLACWRLGDTVYRRLRHFDFEDLDGTNIFRIRIRHYAGPAFDLPGGDVVQDGDWVGFLHFYNMRLQGILQNIQSENRRVLLVAREVKRSLPELAEFLRKHPRGERIKALMGVTLLNRGVEPFGFTVMNVPDTAWFRFKNWYMRLMMAFCHPDGFRRLSRRDEAMCIKRVVMPADELFFRYGANCKEQ